MSEKDEKDKQIADLRAENERLKADIDSWQTVIDYARGGGATDSGPGDLQALIEGLWKQLADLRAENERLEKDRQRLITSNEHWHTRVNQLRDECDQLRGSLDHINDCCLRAEAERDKLKAQLAKIQSE